MIKKKPQEWLKVTKNGLFVAPGNFFIDPNIASDMAVVTHAHADHILGINELRTFYLKYKARFNIYLTKHTEKSLKKMFKYLFINQKNYPAVLKSNILKTKYIL